MTGCGDGTQTDGQKADDVTADEVVVEEETVDVVEEGDPIDDPAAAVEDEWKSDVEKHLVSIHPNAEAVNDVNYFPAAVTTSYADEEAVDQATGWWYASYLSDAEYSNGKVYDYTFEHRVFDFLVTDVTEIPDNERLNLEDDVVVTGYNYGLIAAQIKREYMEEERLDDTNSVIIADQLRHENGNPESPVRVYYLYISKSDPKDQIPPDYQDFATEEEYMAAFDEFINNYTPPTVTAFIIYHSLDDPMNGVTVMRINDIPSNEAPMV